MALPCVAALAALTCLATAAPMAGEAVDPPPPGAAVYLRGATGSACTEETAEVKLSADSSAVVISFSSFTARVGGGAALSERRRHCQLVFELVAPDGYTYAVTGVEASGEEHLEPGATAQIFERIYWVGSSASDRRRLVQRGPLDGAWNITSDFQPATLAYMPCGERRYSNVASEIRVGPGTSPAGSESWVSLESTADRPSLVYHLTWRECYRPR